MEAAWTTTPHAPPPSFPRCLSHCILRCNFCLLFLGGADKGIDTRKRERKQQQNPGRMDGPAIPQRKRPAVTDSGYEAGSWGAGNKRVATESGVHVRMWVGARPMFHCFQLHIMEVVAVRRYGQWCYILAKEGTAGNRQALAVKGRERRQEGRKKNGLWDNAGLARVLECLTNDNVFHLWD